MSEYITVRRCSCSLLGSRESYVWNDLQEEKWTLSHCLPSVSATPWSSRCSHSRIPGMEHLCRCAHALERVPVCYRWRALPLGCNDKLGELADGQGGWKWSVTTMFSGLPATPSAWWKIHCRWYYVSVKRSLETLQKKKKVRTSASCDAVGLFTPLYHYRFMISLRVIQNDYGFLLDPKLHLPSNH